MERGEIYKFKKNEIFQLARVDLPQKFVWASYNEKTGMFERLNEREETKLNEHVENKKKEVLKLNNCAIDLNKMTYKIDSERKARPMMKIYYEPVWCYYDKKENKWKSFTKEEIEEIEFNIQGLKKECNLLNERFISFREMFLLHKKNSFQKMKVMRLPCFSEMCFFTSNNLFSDTIESSKLPELSEEEIEKIRKRNKTVYSNF